jgi:hypothetical protein
MGTVRAASLVSRHASLRFSVERHTCVYGHLLCALRVEASGGKRHVLQL